MLLWIRSIIKSDDTIKSTGLSRAEGPKTNYYKSALSSTWHRGRSYFAYYAGSGQSIIAVGDSILCIIHPPSVCQQQQKMRHN